MESIIIPLAIVQRLIIQFVASPNLFLLPSRSLATALFISTSARGTGNWGKAADSYFSSLLGSGGKSTVLMKPRSKVGAPGGPVSRAAVAGLRIEPQPCLLVCLCVSAG